MRRCTPESTWTRVSTRRTPRSRRTLELQRSTPGATAMRSSMADANADRDTLRSPCSSDLESASPVATGLALSRSDEHGDLSVSLSALASAMDDRIAVAPGVRRCNSSVRRDRGVRLVETRVHVDSGVHLRMLTEVVGDVAQDVEVMLSGDAPAARVRVYVK